LVSLAAVVALAAPPAPVTRPVPGVSDTSFVADNGDRTMRLSIDMPVPPSRVWKALSTAEGWRALSVKTAYVDFREGGVIETSYRAGSPKGDPDNIKNQIIAYVPDRLLVFRNVQAPRDFKDAALFARVTTTIAIEALRSGGCRVTLSGDGYAAGPGFDALYGKFLGGNASTLVSLRDALTSRPPSAPPDRTASP